MYGRALSPGLGGTGLALLLYAIKDINLACWMAWVLGVIAGVFLVASLFFGAATLPVVYKRWPRIGRLAGVEDTRSVVEALGKLHAAGNSLRRAQIPDRDNEALDDFDTEVQAWIQKARETIRSLRPEWESVFMARRPGSGMVMDGLVRYFTISNELNERLAQLQDVMQGVR